MHYADAPRRQVGAEVILDCGGLYRRPRFTELWNDSRAQYSTKTGIKRLIYSTSQYTAGGPGNERRKAQGKK